VGVQGTPADKAVPEGAEGSAIDHLNSAYLQLGLVALAFSCLQVWWIGSTMRKRDLIRPLNEGAADALDAQWLRC
jgi:hypothetical protein